MSRIRHKVLKAPLVQHFVNQNHQYNDFTCIVLEVVTAHDCKHRDLYRCLLQRKTYWISKLNTLIPKGLNQDRLQSFSLCLHIGPSHFVLLLLNLLTVNIGGHH